MMRHSVLFSGIALLVSFLLFSAPLNAQELDKAADKPPAANEASRVAGVVAPPIQGTVQAQQGAAPSCNAETEFSVWVFGGTTNQGQLICFKSDNKELQYTPLFMTHVFARVGGFQPQNGLYDQIFLYDMVRFNKKGERVKPKRRLFDYEEMEFQRLNFLPWCRQGMDTSAGKEYVVFVKTPATNYWLDLLSRTVSIGTTLGSVLAGYFIAK